MRWASSTLRKRSGSNKWDIREIEILIAPVKRGRGFPLRVYQPPSIHRRQACSRIAVPLSGTDVSSERICLPAAAERTPAQELWSWVSAANQQTFIPASRDESA